MARPPEWVRTENAACGWLPSLRDHWREINRREREAKAVERAKRKAGDQKRSKCRCAAYPWPHRPGGGFCRHPDPPLERWRPKPEAKRRPHRGRYTLCRTERAREFRRADDVSLRSGASATRLLEEM